MRYRPLKVPAGGDDTNDTPYLAPAEVWEQRIREAFMDGYARGHIERGEYCNSSWHMSKTRRSQVMRIP